MSRRYAVSMASLFPLSWGPGGLARASRYVLARDMALQLSPLFASELFPPNTIPAVSMESARHPHSGNPLGILLRVFGGSEARYPTILDFLLFGPGHKARTRWMRKHVPEAIFVEHAPSAQWLELSPELRRFKPRGQTMLQWVMFLKRPIVLDTFHARRGGRHGEPPLFGDSCHQSIERLALYSQIGLIHFQPFRGSDEIDLLMKGRFTDLNDVLEALRPAAEEVSVVIEVDPRVLLRHRLTDIRDRISEILD